MDEKRGWIPPFRPIKISGPLSPDEVRNIETQLAAESKKLGQRVPMTAKESATAIRGIATELEGKIMLAYVLALNHLADQVEALGKEAK